MFFTSLFVFACEQRHAKRVGARQARAGVRAWAPPWDDDFSPGSALERLIDLNGKVLRLGADPDATTLIHYAEHLADLPNKRRVRRHRLVSTAGGPTVRVVDSLNDSHGIVDYPGEDYFAAILRAYLAEGRARTGTVGGSASALIDARDMAPFAVSWMNTTLSACPVGIVTQVSSKPVSRRRVRR